MAARARSAAQYSADRPVGATAQQAPAWQKHAGIDQNLNHPLPLDATFKDETGRDVKLGDYFHHNRPVMMELMYYNCQMLCPQVLHGMATALRQSGFQAGNQYDVVVTSIDPADTPANAAMEKQHFLSMLDAPSAPPLRAFPHRTRSRPSPSSPRLPASTTSAYPAPTAKWISSPTPASS